MRAEPLAILWCGEDIHLRGSTVGNWPASPRQADEPAAAIAGLSA